MNKIYRKLRQYICWVRGGRDTEYCRFFHLYSRFAEGACKDCKYRPREEVQE